MKCSFDFVSGVELLAIGGALLVGCTSSAGSAVASGTAAASGHDRQAPAFTCDDVGGFYLVEFYDDYASVSYGGEWIGDVGVGRVGDGREESTTVYDRAAPGNPDPDLAVRLYEERDGTKSVEVRQYGDVLARFSCG
jgi:hypothetical protein